MRSILVLAMMSMMFVVASPAHGQSALRSGARAAKALRKLGERPTSSAKPANDATGNAAGALSKDFDGDDTPRDLFPDEVDGDADLPQEGNQGMRSSRRGGSALRSNEDEDSSDNEGRRTIAAVPSDELHKAQRESREARFPPDPPGGGLVLAIVVPVLFPALVLSFALLATRFLQRTTWSRGRWLTLAVLIACGLAIFVMVITYVLSTLVENAPGGAAKHARDRSAEMAFETIRNLIGIVVGLSVVSSVVSVFRFQAKDAVRSLCGPRFLAGLVCVSAAVAWWPVAMTIRHLSGSGVLSRLEMYSLEVLFPVAAFVAVFGIAWGLCGLLGASLKSGLAIMRRAKR